MNTRTPAPLTELRRTFDGEKWFCEVGVEHDETRQKMSTNQIYAVSYSVLEKGGMW